MLQDLRLTIVVENSASLGDTPVWAQHGLSIFLETELGSESMKLLMDTGASSEVMLHNADALHIDLHHLDLISLSHGHYDHTGGLMGRFAEAFKPQKKEKQKTCLYRTEVYRPPRAQAVCCD